MRRCFAIAEADRVWVADITEVVTGGVRWHLVLVMDLASRRVIAASLGSTPSAALAARAIEIALARRKPRPGLIVHTDRGGAFASRRFHASVVRYGALQSMSRRHNPWDNAPAESLIATVKRELPFACVPRGRAPLEAAIAEYFDWYNHVRLHSALGYRSPVQFEIERQSQSITAQRKARHKSSCPASPAKLERASRAGS